MSKFNKNKTKIYKLMINNPKNWKRKNNNNKTQTQMKKMKMICQLMKKKKNKLKRKEGMTFFIKM
jgi:hypothetical protein